MAIEKPTWIYKSKGDKQTASEMNQLAQSVIINATELSNIKDDVAELSNKTYNPEEYSGMGRAILRKNIVNGVNVLTQEMIDQENTIYIIQYDYNLNNQTITIPSGCVLLFEGGSISNGSVQGNNTSLVGREFFSSILLIGKFKELNLSIFKETDLPLSIFKSFIECSDNINIDISDISIIVDNITSPISINKSIDFRFSTIKILNNYKNTTIFSTFNSFKSIVIDKNIIDGKDFTTIVPDLRKEYLINIYDANKWVSRGGEDSGDIFTRRDLLYIVNGSSFNNVISHYNNPQSSPVTTISELENTGIVFQNANFILNGEYSITLLSLEGVSKYTIENLQVNTLNVRVTPSSIFSITNSANIYLNNCNFLNSNDDEGGSAYIFYINNVFNIEFSNIIASSLKWGVMGGDNINTLTINDSLLNRADIHCYGKSININRTEFIGKESQFSGIFDYINFNSCTFNNIMCVLYEGTYKSWIKHDLNFNNCYFNNNQLVSLYDASYINDLSNQRPELQKAFLPNININNCILNSGYYHILYSDNSGIHYNGDFIINIDNLIWKAPNKELLKFSRYDTFVEDSITINIKNTNLLGLTEATIINDSTEFYNNPLSLSNLTVHNSGRIGLNFYDSFVPYIWYNGNLNLRYKDSIVYKVSYNRANTVSSILDNCKVYFNSNPDSSLIIDNCEMYKCYLYQYNKALNLTQNKKFIFEDCISDTEVWNNFYYSSDPHTTQQYANELLGVIINNKKVIFTKWFSYDTMPFWRGGNGYNLVGNKYYDTSFENFKYYKGDLEWSNEDGTLTSKVIII